ncbi:hypothetical protein BDW72DRAFT_203302 [Aspergillus terricola var. indicus]
MAPHRRNIGASRRKRREDEGEDEGSLDGEMEDDSLSEGSIISQQDEDDADGEGSDESDDENIPVDSPGRHEINGRVPEGPQRRHSMSPNKNSLATTMSDTDAMMNGLKVAGDGKGVAEINFDEMEKEAGQIERAPSAPPTEASMETFTDKSLGAEKLTRGKGDDPTVVPTRGSFFLHDKRSTESGANNYRPSGKSKSRPYGLIVDGNVRRKQDITTEGPWTHDLHDTVAGDEPPATRRPTASAAILSFSHKQLPTTVPTAPNTSTPNRTFSTTQITGTMPVVVFLPGMGKPISFQADKKHYTRLPEHRPPLRRDKPVRISVPGQAPRYIFPATERSFVFIPRAQRPNQQAYRGRARGGFYQGRRSSFYASSTYTPSVAMSRRSSFGKPPSHDGYPSPAGSVISRHTVITTENGKPIVRLPPPRVPGANPAPATASIPPIYSQQPQQTVWRESRPAPIPMHQPRPQKAVSLADIETPASFANSPRAQQEQPFHHQVPVPSSGPVYGPDASANYALSAHTTATPLSQIPERAVHAPPFHAYGYQQPQTYYPNPYPPAPVYYPVSGTEYAPYNGVGPGPAAPFPTGQNVPYVVPTPSEPTSQAGTVAHESGGTVYYLDASQMYPGPTFGGSPAGGAANMGGIMTPGHAVMSAPTVNPVGPGTLITVKVTYEDHTRRFKIPLRDLGARTLPQNLRQLLGTPADTNVIFERYSDSAGSYVQLDSNNPAVFKQLYRAAKAKLKLRIKATVVQPASQPTVSESISEPRYSYLETVLSHPIPGKAVDTNESASTLATTLPVSAERTTLLETHDPFCSATEMEGSKSVSHREFILGPDNPSAPVISHTSAAGVFCIDCDHCGRPIPNEHYHCNTCSDGDYDLCPQCIDSGVNCQGEDHWLVRRFVKDGIITNSTTKTLASHKIQTRDEHKPQPEPVLESAPGPIENITINRERVCNNCLKEFDEGKMVSCADCDDFDLCITCILGHKHGHHPSHTFVLLGDHDAGLKNLVLSRCKPGRGYHHAAICDGCESHITGVRHKCLTCPDWDYCSECHLSASRTHPGHRFAPLYTAISEPLQSYEVHFGVFCDGPLCKDKPRSGYITGVRYKCSVCNDTDFCVKCEVHPSNTHNRTHPMVMLKTPVRSVSVNTVHENTFTQETNSVGDHTQGSKSTQASAPIESDTEMETVAEKKVQLSEDSAKEEKSINLEKTSSPVMDSEYQAFFLEDTISDGTAMQPNQVFQQTWKLYNPGPLAWPAGSNVRFVGGDSMFIVDTNHPSSLASVTAAMESNKLSQPLEAGQSAEFTVNLKAPRRLGSAISYWRMKLADGTPFGHRLWCDIQVREDLAPAAHDSKDKNNNIISEKAPESAAVNNSDISESQMVFPKLDKESPAASTHEAVNVLATAPSVTDASERDVFDDMASLTLGEETSTETGFLTDEEYDILDASDQEFLDANSSR